MLGKLIKYEFKALYKKILLCVVGGLLISLLTLLLYKKMSGFIRSRMS